MLAGLACNLTHVALVAALPLPTPLSSTCCAAAVDSRMAAPAAGSLSPFSSHVYHLWSPPPSFSATSGCDPCIS